MGLLSRLLKNNKEDKNTTKIESTGESFLPSEQVDTDQEKKAEVPLHPESTRLLALRANGVDELFEDVLSKEEKHLSEWFRENINLDLTEQLVY